MKKFLVVLIGSLAMVAVKAQNTTQSKAAESLNFKESSFDFGNIQQGRPVTHIFSVTNTGTTAIRLENVQASCGCTTPEWSKDPIQPGATTEIKVGYNAAAEGPFHKSVTITYEGNQMKSIIISGTVYKSPTTSAPSNASIVLLKQINH